MTAEIGAPYRRALHAERSVHVERSVRVERLTIDEAESGSGIARLMRWQTEFMLEVLDGALVLDRLAVALSERFPRPDPPRRTPWGVVPCGRPRAGMGVAVPNTDRVTMRNVTPRLERRR